jgi:flavin reductase (DIM6/NTAB) family NADH-FMN oxidoreductase RutF
MQHGGGIAGNDKIFLCLSNHKTTENIARTKEFTVSVADAEHLVEADYLGMVSAHKVPDKVAKAGLHTTKSKFVNAPIIDEFPITLKRKLVDDTPYGIGGKIENAISDGKNLM